METLPAPLKGKVALVTGASRGIGACIAETFAKHGCTHIALTYVSNAKTAGEVMGRIKAINSNIKTTSIAMDVRDPDSGKATVEAALKGLEIDHIDIVVSNASMVDSSSFQNVDDMTKEYWDMMMTANAWTPLVLARESSKAMPRGGRIILMSSASSKLPQGDPHMAYGCAKAAGDAVVRNMAAAYGVQKGITVNSISVGAVETDALKLTIDSLGPEYRKMAEEFALLKRVGQPQEIADIVAFIASPASGFIHGNQVPANGGGLAMLQS